MKKIGILGIVLLALGFGNATRANATNLVVNGDFGSPNVGGGWSAFASIPGWNTNGNGIEIDNPAVFGGGSVAAPGNGSDQSLELNFDYPENVYQTVTGLTPGQSYTLTWAYGDRPNSGNDQTMVTWNGVVVATDTDLLNGSNPTLLWFANSVTVVATGTSDVLSFNGNPSFPGVNNNGGPSYGNEIDNVSLVAATPEPSTWLLMLTGIGLLGFIVLRKQGSFSFGSF